MPLQLRGRTVQEVNDRVGSDTLAVGPISIEMPVVGERRLSPRRTTSTKVVFAVAGDVPRWAGLVCDASDTGILLCCEPHPQVTTGTLIILEDAAGRWAEGRVARTAAHETCHLLSYYGVQVTAVSHEMCAQFPHAPVERRWQDLEALRGRVWL